MILVIFNSNFDQQLVKYWLLNVKKALKYLVLKPGARRKLLVIKLYTLLNTVKRHSSQQRIRVKNTIT